MNSPNTTLASKVMSVRERSQPHLAKQAATARGSQARLDAAIAGTSRRTGRSRSRKPLPTKRVHNAEDGPQSCNQGTRRPGNGRAFERECREPLEVAEHDTQRLFRRDQGACRSVAPRRRRSVAAVDRRCAGSAGLRSCVCRRAWETICRRRWTKRRRITGAISVRFDERAPLPDDVQSACHFRAGTDALARRLAMTGVVFHDQGATLQNSLKAGQRLVSPRGDLWRWDGFSHQPMRRRKRRSGWLSEIAFPAWKRRSNTPNRLARTPSRKFSEAKAAADVARKDENTAEHDRARRAEQALIAAQVPPRKSRGPPPNAPLSLRRLKQRSAGSSSHTMPRTDSMRRPLPA